MNLSLFQELTGITVSEADAPRVLAQIRRTQRVLESMLGFTLDPEKTNQNLYNELGKTPNECSCPDVSPENLLPPDEVVFGYRLFPYNDKDKYFHVDPFYHVHKVKLVYNGVTIKTFEEDEVRFQIGNGWGKFIENCQKRICSCKCTDCVQLAVDADWLFVCDSTLGDSSIGCINDDLLYVWADMISYYADCKKDVKQESVGSHSYTKFDKSKIAPEQEAHNLQLLKKYAGPHGTLTKTITP